MSNHVLLYPSGHYRRIADNSPESLWKNLQNAAISCCIDGTQNERDSSRSRETSMSRNLNPSEYGDSALETVSEDGYYSYNAAVPTDDGRGTITADSSGYDQDNEDYSTYRAMGGRRASQKSRGSMESQQLENSQYVSADAFSGSVNSYENQDKPLSSAGEIKGKYGVYGTEVTIPEENKNGSGTIKSVIEEHNDVSGGNDVLSSSDVPGGSTSSDALSLEQPVELEEVSMTGADHVAKIIYSDDLSEPFETNPVTAKLYGDGPAGHAAMAFPNGGQDCQPARLVVGFAQCSSGPYSTMVESLRLRRLGETTDIPLPNIKDVYDNEADIVKLAEDNSISTRAAKDPNASVAIFCEGLPKPIIVEFPNPDIRDEFSEELKYKVATKPSGRDQLTDSTEAMGARSGKLENMCKLKVNTKEKPGACDRWVTVDIFLRDPPDPKQTRIILDYETQWLCLQRKSQRRTLPIASIQSLYSKKADVEPFLGTLTNDKDTMIVFMSQGFKQPFVISFSDTATKELFAEGFQEMLSKESQKNVAPFSDFEKERAKRNSESVEAMVAT